MPVMIEVYVNGKFRWSFLSWAEALDERRVVGRMIAKRGARIRRGQRAHVEVWVS
jgi:hypothetical protein